MHRSPKWSPLAAFAATVALVFAACGGSTATTAPTEAPATVAPPTEAPASAAPYEGTVYPETGEAPCGAAPYTGQLKKLTAVDALTVEFQLCGPDAAFLAKIAFSAFGIHDSDYLAAHAADGSYLDQPNGTGPYTLEEWSKGNRMVFKAFDGYWGDKALTPNLEFRWSDEAAQRLLELQSGNVDGIDNPGTSDIATIQADSSLQFAPRPGLNTMYLGFNDTIKPFDDVKVRQAIAMGINRQQLVDNFYPAGSTVADYFTPCEIPFACEGDNTWDFDPTAAKQLLADAGFPNGFETKLQFRAAVRGYLPDPPVIATEIQQQLKANLGITATLDLQESGAFLDANTAGTLDGIFILGWGADYPDPSNFLDYHFGPGSGAKFGEPFQDIVDALSLGIATANPAARTTAYTTANNRIKEHVPAVIMAHGASGAAYKADVENAYASVFGAEVFATMKAGDRDTLVWMQNAEPLSLYCGDEDDGETLRACEMVNESLYRYEVGGAASIPSLATECTANAESTVWTCALRSGVKFHDGADLDANDVVVSYAAEWDTQHPLHKGRSGAFGYFPGLWGGFLNPPAS
ncbi:MAG: ABC transporter substrate-binding protein [Candidatus Limnocylindrales bacterium]|nr:ABC transporter substrate-binding protein [Candidatus Limnocylindrales bacterium]